MHCKSMSLQLYSNYIAVNYAYRRFGEKKLFDILSNNLWFLNYVEAGPGHIPIWNSGVEISFTVWLRDRLHVTSHTAEFFWPCR